MKNLLRLTLACVAGLTLAFALGCSSDKSADKGKAGDALQVGIILPLSGDQAKFGEIEKKSFDMALEEINAAGGINGKKLAFLYEDDTGKPDVGRSAAEKLITKDKVLMLSGGYSSSVTKAVAGVAQQNKLPFLICTGSADDITEQGWDYVFRLNPPASEYPRSVETFLTQIVQPKSVAILYENSNFGTSSSKEFSKTCEKLGIQVVVMEGYESGGVDFKPLLVKVKEKNPDIVYMVSYVMDASLLMKQAAEIKIKPKAFIGGGAGFTLPEFIQNTGPLGNGVFSATLWYQTLPYPGAQKYFDDYRKKFNGETEYHGAEAYAAAYVVADTLKRAKGVTPEEIKQSLLATNMMTVFGPVKFVSYDKKVNQNQVATYMVQWLEGKLELVWPEAQASKKFMYPLDWDALWKK